MLTLKLSTCYKALLLVDTCMIIRSGWLGKMHFKKVLLLDAYS